jgi:histidinol-phosphate aminotransferase
MDIALAHNTKWLHWLTTEIRALGLYVTPSVGNFLLVHFNSDKSAPMADAFLQDHGLVVRRMEGYGLPAALRMSVGTEEANHKLVATLRAFLA